MNWIPRARPTIGRKATVTPTHLRPVTDAFERIAAGEQVFMVVNVPRQHGKTTVCEAGFVWLMKRLAGLRCAFVTYNDRRAWKESTRMRQNLVRPAGLELARSSQAAWEARNGSSAIFSGVNGGGVIGEPVDFALVDDTLPNRRTAESPTERENRWEWLSAVLFPAVQDTGSVLLVETRWHVDDTSGRLIEQGLRNEGFPWEFVVLRALDDEDRPLAPEIRSKAYLDRLRNGGMTEYDWESLMQSNPRPRGALRFGRFARYTPTELGAAGQLRISIGLDLAYTAKTASDWTVAYVVGRATDGRVFVLDRVKVQKAAAAFAAEDVPALRARYREARWRFYGYGPELGAASHLEARGVPIYVESRSGDKLVRSLNAMAEHNAGRLLWPEAAPWLRDAERVIGRFTGVGDAEDDDVDAIAAAVDQAIEGGAGGRLGVRRYGAEERDLAVPGLGE